MSEPVIAQQGPFFVELKAGRTYYWCACGRSRKQPFCDGSHVGTKFFVSSMPMVHGMLVYFKVGVAVAASRNTSPCASKALLRNSADQMGSVEDGKLADLVLLNKDPTADINNTKSIVFVTKGGELIDESKLPLAGGKQPRRFTP